MKNKKILVGCLALLLVMSIGYAIFSESITVNGTLGAKGDFEVLVESCTPGIDPSFNMPGYENNPPGSTCNINKNNVSINTAFSYPGQTVAFTIKVINNSEYVATFNPSSLGVLSENVKAKLCADGYKRGEGMNPSFTPVGVMDNTITEDECTSNSLYDSSSEFGYTLVHQIFGGMLIKTFNSNHNEISTGSSYHYIDPKDYIYIVAFGTIESLNESGSIYYESTTTFNINMEQYIR